MDSTQVKVLKHMKTSVETYEKSVEWHMEWPTRCERGANQEPSASPPSSEAVRTDGALLRSPARFGPSNCNISTNTQDTHVHAQVVCAQYVCAHTTTRNTHQN